MSYEIFKRRAWRKEGGKFVPDGGARKTHVMNVNTADEARTICMDHNKDRPPYGSASYFNFVNYEWTANN